MTPSRRPEGRTSPSQIRLFLALETAIFAIAALIHLEVLFDGYRDPSAAIAESVIGVVLLLGLVVSGLSPAWTRRIGLMVQGFALLGTLVGLTLLLTVGPTTGLDLGIHLVMLIVLVLGLVITLRREPLT